VLGGLAAAASLGGLVVAGLDAGSPQAAQAGHAARSAASLKAHLISTTVGRDCAAADACLAIDITKVADRTLVSAGDQIGYEITVTNDSHSTARAVTMTDTLPANPGTSWTVGASSFGWICAITTGKLTCGGSRTTLASGRSLKVHVTSTTTSGTCGTVSNTATVSTSNVGTATATARIRVECAKIELTKTADNPRVSPGDPIGYTITATNSGAGTARGVTMTDTLPAKPGTHWTIASHTPGWSCTITGTTLTCGGPTTSLGAGDSLRVHITSPTTTATCGAVDNTAHVTTSNDGSATASAGITVECASIDLTKTALRSPVSAGDEIGYEIVASNHGSGTAHGVTMTDTLPSPAGTHWTIESSSLGWTCHLTGAALTCGGPTTSLGAGQNLHVRVTSPTTAATCGTLDNTAHVTTSNDGSASASAHIEVLCAKIEITKTADHPHVSAGDQIGYEITVSNHAPGTAHGVTMTDNLPTTAGTLWTESHSPGWSCLLTGTSLTCGGPTTSLGAGDSLTVHVTSPTKTESCGTVHNTASVVTSNDGTDSASANIEVQCARIELTKTADATTVSAGDPIGYVITATNGGAGTARGVTMTDTLPTTVGLSWTIASSSGWTCGIAGHVLTCGGPSTDLIAAASATVHITSTTSSDTCGDVANTAHVTTSNDGSATASARIEVQCPQIELTKTADSARVSAGDDIGYTITATNNGSGIAHDVTMTDTLPTAPGGLSWTIATQSGWTCGIATGVLTCGGTGINLTPAATATVHITSTTTSASCGTVRNVAHISTSNDGDAEAAAEIEVLCANISITKTAEKPLVSAGDPIGYEITVTNHGPGTAHGVTMTDTLPANAGLSWSPGTTSPGWTCGISAGLLTCGGPTTSLGRGDSLRVHISSPTTSASCGKVQNTAHVATSNDGSATASARIEVLCARIAIVKTADKPLVSAGDPIDYQITVINHGAGTAHGVVMTDPLPTSPGGLSWAISSVSPGWTCGITAGTLTCTGSAAGLPPGGSLRVHITSATTSASCGTVTNTAHVTTTNDGSASDTAKVVVLCAKIELTKTPDDAVVSAGDPIGYTITATNHGAGTARGVTMTDTLPTTPGTAWSFDSVSPGWTCAISAGVLTCGGPSTTLSFGRSLKVHISSPTTSESCGVVDNTAHVTTTNDGTATASARIEVQCARIDLTKTADDTQVSAGDQIGYTITATNNGAGTARGVTMTDTLPVTPGTAWTIASASPGWTCAITSGVLTCGGPTTSLSSGDSLQVHITSPTTSASCGPVDNTANVSTTNDGSAHASASIEVQCAKIEITKTADQSPVVIGSGIGYQITVTNGGVGTARNVTMTDPLPGIGAAWHIDAQSPGWTCAITAGVLTCGGTGTDLAAGASLRVHISTPTTRAACGPVNNTATVTTTNDGTASATATVIVACPLDPSISTKVSRTVIGQGGTLTDTATLTGSAGTVTGTVDFQLCSGTTTGCPKGSGTNFDANVPLVNGMATSRPFGAHLPPGQYCVGLVYLNDGHSPYADYYSGSATGECFSVRKHEAHVRISTRLSRNKIAAGGSVRDFARLHGASRPVHGVVQYRVYRTLRGCRADTSAWPARPRHGIHAGTVLAHGTVVPPSRWIRFRRAGTYYWAAFYTGGPRNRPAASRCLTEVLRVFVPRSRVSVTTWLSTHLTWVGQPVIDWATLHGITRRVSGTVQFRYYRTLRGCRADVSSWPARPLHGVFVDRLVVHGPRTPDTRSVRFRRAGTYYWAAFYSGDARNGPAASSCVSEILRVR